ncbi:MULTISPECIES: aldo/keto reductase [Bacteroides]|uniref:aldo/keto reductase n=1 Tax=Bacteroides TaxID=816 RepID=UPI0004BA5181|nr:aldo/keto reductase [Bacteroides neonati]
MNYRILGKTGFRVSEISLGTWQLGSKWGEEFNEQNAMDTLEAAYQAGINFIDTADIYQGGESERAIGKFLKTKEEKIFVVTKCGRKLDPHCAQGYNAENINRFVEDSLRNMQVDSLDLVLLHCPPSEVYHNKTAFDALDRLKASGKIQHYGVSVERIDEALQALEYDISAIEIIFNMFRLRPAQELFERAQEKNVGIIVRVPLASGLLTGKYTAATTFGAADHRSYNRNGEAFDKGETFSGVDYTIGLQAAQELKEGLQTDNLALSALRYILMYPAVSSVIPGASSPMQITQNARAAMLPSFTPAQMQLVEQVYNLHIKPLVHHLW